MPGTKYSAEASPELRSGVTLRPHMRPRAASAIGSPSMEFSCRTRLDDVGPGALLDIPDFPDSPVPVTGVKRPRVWTSSSRGAELAHALDLAGDEVVREDQDNDVLDATLSELTDNSHSAVSSNLRPLPGRPRKLSRRPVKSRRIN